MRRGADAGAGAGTGIPRASQRAAGFLLLCFAACITPSQQAQQAYDAQDYERAATMYGEIIKEGSRDADVGRSESTLGSSRSSASSSASKDTGT